MSERFPTPNHVSIEPHAPSFNILLSPFFSKYILEVRHIYRRFFKKITLIRVIVNYSLRNLFVVVKFLSNSIYLGYTSKCYSIIGFKDYVCKNGLTVTPLISGCSAQTFLSKVYPLKDSLLVTPKLLSYEFCSIDVVTLQNTMIVGGSNLVFRDGIVICHDFYDFKSDLTSEEQHNFFCIDPNKNTIRIKKTPKHIETLPTAAVFLDACAHNYSHWITEVLPRIAAFCKEDHLKDVPLIIDEGLHINLMESLGPIVGCGRKILTLNKHQFLHIQSLFLVSSTGYVPFGVRSRRFGEPSQGIFSPLALKQMTEMIFREIKGPIKRQWPDKILIIRLSETRNLLNGSKLELALIERGYQQVDPGELTFLEQVQLFRGARKIVATTGAALANAIFAPPGSKITVIMSKHQDMIYKYWLNMLSPLGLNISYIFGNICTQKDLGIHADFVISDQCLLDYLSDSDDLCV